MMLLWCNTKMNLNTECSFKVGQWNWELLFSLKMHSLSFRKFSLHTFCNETVWSFSSDIGFDQVGVHLLCCLVVAVYPWDPWHLAAQRLQSVPSCHAALYSLGMFVSYQIRGCWLMCNSINTHLKRWITNGKAPSDSEIALGIHKGLTYRWNNLERALIRNAYKLHQSKRLAVGRWPSLILVPM